MKSDTIFHKYTDFISDFQDLIYWGFNYQVLKKAYNTEDYSWPVRMTLFKVFKELAESKNSFIKYRCFTVFIGDYGDEFKLFGIGTPSRTSGKVIDFFSKHFHCIAGYECMGGSSTPWVSLLPVYRYEYGLVIEYTYGNDRAGKKGRDEEFGTGIRILHRKWESAEGLGMKQVYGGIK